MNRKNAIEILLNLAEAEIETMGGQDGYAEIAEAVAIMRAEQAKLQHLYDGNPNSWMDAGESVFYAQEALASAKTIGEQGRAFDDLSNAVSDLATFLPDYNYETGQLDLYNPIDRGDD